jgi:hypothetical protein
MSPAWRWRKCPTCGVVERASDFLAVQPLQGWGTGFLVRECSRCGWLGRTWQFTVARERHPAEVSRP